MPCRTASPNSRGRPGDQPGALARPPPSQPAIPRRTRSATPSALHRRHDRPERHRQQPDDPGSGPRRQRPRQNRKPVSTGDLNVSEPARSGQPRQVPGVACPWPQSRPRSALGCRSPAERRLRDAPRRHLLRPAACRDHGLSCFFRVGRGSAFWLARKSFPHGRPRQSPRGPERSAGPAPAG